jgi:cytochrome oxidase Cu insertion factor (SCO1/SenC/PrrC family)
MRLTLVILIASLAVASEAQAPGRTADELGKLGPQVGQPVPDFSLNDQNGVTRSLKSILGPNGAMLVFFRSADW